MSDDEQVSKSQKKRDHRALQSLAAKLIELPSTKLDELELTAEIRESITAGRSMEKGALRRQHRYIAKQLAAIDAEQIEFKLAEVFKPAVQEVRRFHLAERWRERLLDGDRDVVAEIAQACPALGQKELSALVNGARAGDKKAQRELFRYLRDLQDTTAG
ncbi:MAG: ribosome biogenesis factor YjgA [Pseudomonadota bacterium]